ncbi:MAG: glutaredoxin family protein [Acidimicrobiia bacterium]
MSAFTVTFVTKRDCPLCARAEPIVMRWTSRLGAPLERVYIEDEPEMKQLFSERVPVVLGPDGSVVAEGSISSARLALALGRAKLAGSL